MTKYRILITSQAQKDIRKLDPMIRNKIITSIFNLEMNRTPQQFKPLVGKSVAEFRIRIGNYRVLYDVYDEKKEVLILRIGHRKDIYR